MEHVNKTAKDEERWLKGMAGTAQWCPSDAERVISAWQASGKSMAGFADTYGINARRIAWWRKRVAMKDMAPASKMEFVPVTIRAASTRPGPAERSAAPVTLSIVGVGVIEVAEPENVSPVWIAALVGELARTGGVA